jgi:RNA polymerase sigma-70 factor, ECF subfamily
MALLPPTRISLILRLANPADLVAWEEFVSIYGPAIYRLVLGRGLQAADAEDVAQEILFAIARSVERFNHDPQRARFRTWLGRIARNVVADYFRGRQRQPRIDSLAIDLREIPHAASTGQTGAASSWQPEAGQPDAGQPEVGRLEAWNEEAWNEELRTAVFERAAAIVRERVAASTWSAFEWTALKQRSAEEVARQLAIPIGSVYVHRCRVLKLIRHEVARLLAELDGQPAEEAEPHRSTQDLQANDLRQGTLAHDDLSAIAHHCRSTTKRGLTSRGTSE